MVHLVALLCHRSRLVSSQRSRTRRATALMTPRRPFFSFLGYNKSNRLTEAETATKVKQEQGEATRILLDGVYHRISIQHAHPLGPWQAMLTVVQDHYNKWVEVQTAKMKEKDNTAKITIASTGLPTTTASVVPFRVLDLACGPRGEPAVAAIPIQIFVDEAIVGNNTAAANVGTGVDIGGLNEKKSVLSAITEDVATIQVVPLLSSNHCPLIIPPPKNLTKSVTDLTDLSSYGSNSFDAIICCYGYNLSSNIPHALSEAYRVLIPGGVLVIATWERSAMLSIGRDVEAYVRGGGRDPYTTLDDDEAFLPPRLVPVKNIELSEVGELEGLLAASGFGHKPQAVVATSLVYPIDLGSTPADQFAMGTILVRGELESLGALGSPGSSNGAGGWGNLAEEAFFMNIKKYVDVVEGNLLLRDNTFKLVVSTKK